MAAANDRQTLNPIGELLFHQDHPPIRRSSGRRKSSSSTAAGKKKKTPQRGMGVEKLENLRMQEGLTKMTEINHQSFTAVDRLPDPVNFMVMNNASSAPIAHQLPISSQMNLNQSAYMGYHGHMGVGGRFPNSDRKFGINSGCINHSEFFGASGLFSELSSTPNSVGLSLHYCNDCHKKKKIVMGEGGFSGLKIGDNQNIMEENQGFVGYSVGNLKKGVEVVAVHKKGSEEERMVEYQFFPTSERGDDELVMMGSSGTSSSSPVAASNCIDLSLKLSY